MGQGKGSGDGRGGDQATGIIAGSAVACCFLVCMWVIGIPLFIAGIAMVQMNDNIYGTDDMYVAGIVCIVLSVIFMIVGIVLIVLTCCIGSRKRTPTSQGQVLTGTTVVANTVIQPGPSYPAQPYAGQPQSYPGQPQSYPGQPQQYPGQPQQYPGQPQPYPGQPQPYPGQPQPYPGQPQPQQAHCQKPDPYNPNYAPGPNEPAPPYSPSYIPAKQ